MKIQIWNMRGVIIGESEAIPNEWITLSGNEIIVNIDLIHEKYSTALGSSFLQVKIVTRGA